MKIRLALWWKANRMQLNWKLNDEKKITAYKWLPHHTIIYLRIIYVTFNFRMWSFNKFVRRLNMLMVFEFLTVWRTGEENIYSQCIHMPCHFTPTAQKQRLHKISATFVLLLCTLYNYEQKIYIHIQTYICISRRL